MKYTYKGITISGWQGTTLDNSFNETVFGMEIDFRHPELNWKEKVGDSINLFPQPVRYISPYLFDEKQEKYSILSSLPKALMAKFPDKEKFYGKLMLDYPFDNKYVSEFDFETVNDVLAEIKLGLWKMYADSESGKGTYGYPIHLIDVLRVEHLYYKPQDGTFDIFIGS